jgi:LAO/AO transport system kinase
MPDVLVAAGGIIPDADVTKLKAAGVAEIFGPGTSIGEIARYFREHVRRGDTKVERACAQAFPVSPDATVDGRAPVRSEFVPWRATRGRRLVTDHSITHLSAGERRPLARLLTRIENGDPSVRSLLPELFAAGHGAHVVGITGPPGSGKSTLLNALITEWRRRGKRVGILAVDPSSPYTHGAILGDRIRMMEHAADRDVFMRSMASRGELGGIAATTWIAAAALDAAGYDPVLIETVGAGQSEVEVARLAETTVVVEVPEMGDEVQAIKAGLLEVADIVAVNKGDRPGADRAARQLRAMLSTAGGRVERTPPTVLVTTATTADGVGALADAIEAHRSQARTPVEARARAANQVRRALADLGARRAEGSSEWDDTLRAVAERELDPMTAAERLLDL